MRPAHRAGSVLGLTVSGRPAGVAAAVVLATALMAANVPPSAPALGLASAATVGVVSVPRHSSVVAAMKSAADYYRPTYLLTTGVRNGWSWSTYFQGVSVLYDTAGDQKYLADGMAWGRSTQWSITSAEGNPDSVKAGQVYHDLRALDASASLAAIDARMSADLVGLPADAYWWADALFMGLPNWTRWAVRAGDAAYLEKMDQLYAWTRDRAAGRCAGAPPGGLYDAAEHLWYRDCRYISARDPNGAKIFWGRGNGWVLAAMAQVLSTLPAEDARAGPYRDMLRGMAARLRQLQGADGLWRSSLLDPALYPQPETSATGLITYALAYGINAGLLDPATYLPVVAKAWNGLTTTALRSTGFLSYCQRPGGEPAAPYTGSGPRVAPTTTSAGTLHEDSPPYCAGAFLLAGSEMARLAGPMSTGRPVQATAQQPGNDAYRAVDGDMTTRWSAQGFPQSVTVDLGTYYRASNAMVVPYLDRAYRYRIDTSLDGVTWSLAVDRTATAPAGTAVHGFAGGTRNLRYARLTVVGVSGTTTDWVSIQEFTVHDTYRPRPNLARSRPTTATSSQAPYPPSRATDNESATFWVSAARPTGTAPQRLIVDLQSPASVDTVRVFSRPNYGPSDVAVLASTNGTTWAVLATAILPNAEGPHMLVFPPAQARWLQLRTTSAYSLNNVQVAEFEAYAR